MTWKPAELHITPGQRDQYGVIWTLRNTTTGQLESGTKTGKVDDVLTELCNNIDKRTERWEIISLSTPRTIYRDMQGTRRKLDYTGGSHDSSTSRPNQRHEDPRSAEINMLKRIGRLDLLCDVKTYRRAA